METSTGSRVASVLRQTLQLDLDADQLTAETKLFGSLPEFDSMGVVAVVIALEDEFGIVIEDEEFGSDLFESVGSVAQFVDAKLA